MKRLLFLLSLLLFVPVSANAKTVRIDKNIYKKFEYSNSSYYKNEKKERENYWKLVYKSVRKAGVKNKMPDKVAVRKITNWIADNVGYADDGSVDNHTGGKLFKKGTGDCIDYADAFCSMCKMCGIPCKLYTGIAYNSSTDYGYHAWNRVKIGKKWYWIDPTWYDCGFYNDHKYYLHRKLWKNHRTIAIAEYVN